MKLSLSILALLLCLSVSAFGQLSVGDSVKVVPAPDPSVNLRSIASTSGSTIIKAYPVGSVAVVIGPDVKDINGSSNYSFLQVRFTDGNSGWARDVYFVKIASSPPPPVSGCDTVGAYARGFAAGKASVICPPAIHDTVRVGMDSLLIQAVGVKFTKVNDSTIVAKP